MQVYKISNKCKSIKDNSMKLCTHNNDQVYYWIPKLQPIWTEIAPDVIIQSEWSQILEQENEFEPIQGPIFKPKMVLMTNKFMVLWTTISSSIDWDQCWWILTTWEKNLDLSKNL